MSHFTNFSGTTNLTSTIIFIKIFNQWYPINIEEGALINNISI